MIMIISTGMFMAWSTIASMIMPAPGVPAVPMEARVAVTTMVTIWPRVSVMPQQVARKMVATHW